MALSMSMRLGKVRTAFVVSLLMAVQWFMFIETKVKRLIHTTKININVNFYFTSPRNYA